MNTIKTSIIILFCIIGSSVQAQKKGKKLSYISSTDIEKAVHTNMNCFLGSEDYIEFKNEHPNISGEITCNITICSKRTGVTIKGFSKTLTQTVFISKTSIDDVPFNGKFKDLLMEYEYDFIIKNGVQQKIQHTFIIK